MVHTIVSGICMKGTDGHILPAKAGPGRGALRLVIFVLVIIAVAMCPVTADSKFMTGSPELNAHIAGANEFSPGDDVFLPVVIENTGLTRFKIVDSGIIGANDIPSTAKGLTATLEGSDAPIVIKADPQVLGDLLSGSHATAVFHIRINQDAPAGTYQLPVSLNYTYLYQQFQESNTLSYVYKDINETVYVPLKVKPELQIEVTNVSTDNLVAGNDGSVALSVKNTGYEDGRNAALLIVPSNNSPFLPADGSEYVGDFPRGAVVDSRFRVAVSGDALQKTYPLTVMVNYKNGEGDYVNSVAETVGVPVGGKVAFSVDPVSASASPGANAVIVVQYRNTGGATAYNAQARIDAVDPFTTNDDTAYLGTMAPGDTRTASFDVVIANGATVKQYAVSSVVIYQDSFNNQVTSDPVHIPVQVGQPPGILALVGVPLIIVIVLAVMVFAVRRIIRKRSEGR